MSSNLSVFLRWPAAVSALLFLGAEVRAIYVGGFNGGIGVLLIPIAILLIVWPIVWVEQSGGLARLPTDWSRWMGRWNTRLIWFAFASMNLLFLGVIWRADLFISHGAASR